MRIVHPVTSLTAIMIASNLLCGCGAGGTYTSIRQIHDNTYLLTKVGNTNFYINGRRVSRGALLRCQATADNLNCVALGTP